MSEKLSKTAKRTDARVRRAAESGRFLGVTLVEPQVRPKGTTVTAIRRAVKVAVEQSTKKT